MTTRAVGILIVSLILVSGLAMAEAQQKLAPGNAGVTKPGKYDHISIDRQSGDIDSLFLIYKHRIRCEESSEFPYLDGWDGYDVRIRVAGADTMYQEIEPYQVAADSSYYAPSSHSTHEWDILKCWEAHGEQSGPYSSPWDQWIGGFANHDDVSVETKIFDLRPFAGDTIQICFVGGSDWGVCTVDDSTLFGYIIDDILVVEGMDSTRLADLPSPLGGDTLFFDDFEGPDQAWSYYSKYPVGDYWRLASGGHSGAYKAMCSDDSTLEYVALLDNAIVSPKFARIDLPTGLDSLWLHWWLKCSVDSVNAWAHNMYKLDDEDWEHISVLDPPYERKWYNLGRATNDDWKHNTEWSAFGTEMHDLTPLLYTGWDTLQVLVGFGSDGSPVPSGVVGLQVDDITLIGKQTDEDTLLYFSAEGPGWNDEITGEPWYTVDFTDSLADSMWHKDTFRAISGTYSMWWGDPDIQGYANMRYQALISPKLFIGYDSGHIAGTVSGSGKGPIAGAVVTAEGAETRSDTTDAGGHYLISDLPTGSYDVTATAMGYQLYTENDVAVVADDTTMVDFSLTPCTIDFTWSTFLGGSNHDQGYGIAVDISGCAHVTGNTQSTDFPVTAGAYDTSLANNGDLFVTKFHALGSSLMYSTFLGGGQTDQGTQIAVDKVGNVFVTGRTYSSDFPVTVGAFDTSLAGSSDSFVSKLNATGDVLLFSTFLGGSGSERTGSIAVDDTSQAHVASSTTSSDFPVTGGAFDVTHNGGGYDNYVAKLNATGSDLLYATFVGGGGNDNSYDIYLNDVGQAWVVGEAPSGYPTTTNAFDTTYNGGTSDAVVFCVSMKGDSLVYGSYLGGSESDAGLAIGLDESGRIYLAGETSSDDFPVTDGAFDRAIGGASDGFAARLSVSRDSLDYATFLGGDGIEAVYGLVVDSSRGVFLAGKTGSSDFPATVGAIDSTFNSAVDAFVAWLAAGGDHLKYATFLGGAESDLVEDMALDQAGNVYAVGYSTSSDFPTTSSAYDTSHNGGTGQYDAIVFCLGEVVDLTPPETIDDLTIALESGAKSSSGDVRLIWSEPYDDVGVVRYVIHRSTDPAALGDSLAGTTDTTYMDAGTVGDTGSNYFYVVRAVDGAGWKSFDSNQVGEFDSQMTNGVE